MSFRNAFFYIINPCFETRLLFSPSQRNKALPLVRLRRLLWQHKFYTDRWHILSPCQRRGQSSSRGSTWGEWERSPAAGSGFPACAAACPPGSQTQWSWPGLRPRGGQPSPSTGVQCRGNTRRSWTPSLSPAGTVRSPATCVTSYWSMLRRTSWIDGSCWRGWSWLTASAAYY